jgi:hypothetical protein
MAAKRLVRARGDAGAPLRHLDVQVLRKALSRMLSQDDDDGYLIFQLGVEGTEPALVAAERGVTVAGGERRGAGAGTQAHATRQRRCPCSRQGQERGRDRGQGQDVIDAARLDGCLRHAEHLRGSRVLGDDDAPGLLDGPHSLRAVAAVPRQDTPQQPLSRAAAMGQATDVSLGVIEQFLPR